MKTSALLFHGPNDARLGEIEVDEPAAGEVRVRTLASFVSTGTERWILTDRFSRVGTPFPCVPGYQRVGIVEKTGEGVRDLNAGDRVIATSGSWDGAIPPYWGAHLALGNSRREQVFKLPDRVGDENAAGVVVAQVGYNAASRVAFRGDDWIVVYGDGIIGQCASQAARARGAKTILVGRRRERLALGEKFSADRVVDARSGSIPEQVSKITGGRPVTAVLDTIQQEAVQREYVPLLRTDEGQIVYCGHSSDPSWADMPLLQQRGLTCHYVSDWTPGRIEATISLMDAGGIDLKPLVTHRGTAAEAPGFYRMLIGNTEPFLGIIIDWSTGA